MKYEMPQIEIIPWPDILRPDEDEDDESEMKKVIIHKGEQFAIPFEVKIGDDTATPENINGLRIKVFGKLQEWPNGDLTFDSEENVWLYPLAEDQTRGILDGPKPAQVAVKLGENILKTDVFELEIKNSIIMEPWTNG